MLLSIHRESSFDARKGSQMAAGKRVEMRRYPPSDHHCNYSYFSDLANATIIRSRHHRR